MAENKQQGSVDVTFDIIQPSTRPVIPVSGAVGGVAATGEIVASLYFEYPDIPKLASIKLDSKTGAILESSLPVRKNHFTREIVATISMNTETARAFAIWCNQQADRSEENDRDNAARQAKR